jgi:S1-C subfamily serine protease
MHALHPPKNTRCLVWLSLAATVVFVAGCNSSSSPDSAATSSSATASSATATAAPTATAQGADIPALVRQVEPSVVTVLTASGLGSGIVYQENGTIVTNAHVVAGVDKVTVAFADGQQVPAKVRASDQLSDVAVLEADRQGLTPAKFQKELPQLGEQDIVIGSPLGFEATVTAGIISGVHRQIPGSASTGSPLVDLIQTDAAISPGNSGGAVLDVQGDVVGVSVAYIPPETGAVSLGFAIPAATVVDVADQLLATGTARHAYVGIVPATLTPQIQQKLGVDVARGVVVREVAAGSPAAAAGILPGDIITAVNGEQTPTAEKFIALIRATKPGDRVELTVVRGTTTTQIPITVVDRPPL